MKLLLLRDYLISCPIKKSIGIDCFGCGFQRSIILLLEGKFVESIQMYPATLPMIFLWVYTLCHLIFKFKNGSKVIKLLFIFGVLIILLHYSSKIIDGSFLN